MNSLKKINGSMPLKIAEERELKGKVVDILDRILLGKNKNKLQDKLIIFYSKKEDKFLPSHELDEHCYQKINEWLDVHGSGTEIDEGVYRIDLIGSIFVFEAFEDKEGIVLSGYGLKKDKHVRWCLLNLQANYLTRDSIA